MMGSHYPWYAIIEDFSLEQGDFFFSVKKINPIFMESSDIGQEIVYKATTEEHDVIIISQSCDLERGKIESVLVAPVFFKDQFPEKIENFEKIRQGNIPGFHMLNVCDLKNFSAPIRIVNFRQVFSIPFSYIKFLAETTNPRLRLLPPYREHLSQAFARFIMRVGLPVDIPSLRK